MVAGPRPPVTPNNITGWQHLHLKYLEGSEEAAAIFIYECSAFVPASICANISHSWLTFPQMLRHKDGGSDAESVLKYWVYGAFKATRKSDFPTRKFLTSLRSRSRGTRKRNNMDT